MAKKKKQKIAPEPDLEPWFERRFGPGANDDEGAPEGAAAEARNLTMIALLFEGAERLLDVPAPRVVAGLRRLREDDLHALKNEDVPWPVRERCIAAIFDLFERYFARACGDRPGHLARGKGAASEPDTTCYMWWDVFPLGPDVRERTSDALLDVMERTLALSSPACQEAALHGFGHWQQRAKERVEEIIDAYLAREGVSEPLAAYARQARTGYIQ